MAKTINDIQAAHKLASIRDYIAEIDHTPVIAEQV